VINKNFVIAFHDLTWAMYHAPTVIISHNGDIGSSASSKYCLTG